LESCKKELKQEFIRLKVDERLYHSLKPIIGLTGGIATGKSTVSTLLLNEHGIQTICADKLIKEIYAQEESFEFIQKNFPSAIANKQIDFKSLRELAFAHDKNRETLESFLYQKLPSVFLEQANTQDQSFIVYDVPLLFEKKLQTKLDQSVLVYATREIQKQRLRDRDKSSDELAEKILSTQMPINEKKELSDYIINNESQLQELALQVNRFVDYFLA
jgi:dephospho-CoA kinase